VVNDCSTDRTVEIAKSYEVKDSRIKVYVNEKNLGDYPNRNKAASYAKGKYLKYVDADDLIYPHGIEVMTRDLQKFPDAAMAICTPDDDITPLPYKQIPEEVYREHFFKKDVFGRSPLGVIMKREIFEELGGFSGKRYVGDSEMWMKISAKYLIVRTVMGTGFWRSHGDQEAVKGSFNFNYPKLNKVVLNECLANYCPLPLSEKKMIMLNFKRKEARKLIINLMHLKISYGVKLFREQELNFMDIFSLFAKHKKPSEL
jgi:glycosyltransferase involved in cell wall biosynthesis